MNESRMNYIGGIRADLRLVDQKIEKMMNEEEEYHDNITEAPSDLEATERSEEAIACLTEALDSVTEAISALMEIQ